MAKNRCWASMWRTRSHSTRRRRPGPMRFCNYWIVAQEPSFSLTVGGFFFFLNKRLAKRRAGRWPKIFSRFRSCCRRKFRCPGLPARWFNFLCILAVFLSHCFQPPNKKVSKAAEAVKNALLTPPLTLTKLVRPPHSWWPSSSHFHALFSSLLCWQRWTNFIYDLWRVFDG